MLRRFFDYLPLNNREEPPLRRAATPAERRRLLARHARARQPEQALRHEGADPEGRRRRRLLRAAARVREEHRDRLRAPRRAAPSASSPINRWCWPAASTSSEHQGGALRALLRCVQHPGRHLRRRARLHAGHRAGVRRHHQARREAALRLRRSHGAEGHRDHAQGLRRRLRRDEHQAPPRRRELRLADRRDRGDGREGRGRDHLPRGQGRPGQARGARGRVQGALRQPLRRRRARLHRRRDPAARDAQAHLPVAARCCATRSSDRPDGASTGTSRLSR